MAHMGFRGVWSREAPHGLGRSPGLLPSHPIARTKERMYIGDIWGEWKRRWKVGLSGLHGGYIGIMQKEMETTI